MNSHPRILALLLPPLAAALAPAAFAEPVFPPLSAIVEQDTLTGDWGGLRTRMAEDYGITPGATYVGEVFGNLSGGMRTGAAYEGLLELSLEINLEKTTKGAWPGAIIFGNALVPHGASPTAKYVGDIFSVSNIDAPDSIRLFELWFEQTIEPFSVRIGQLAADSEFAISDGASLFLNGTFGWPAGISANAPAPAYPLAGLGVRVRHNWTDNISFSAGFFDGNPDSVDASGSSLNPNGVHWRLGSDEGMFSIFEFALAHHQPEEPAAENPDPKKGVVTSPSGSSFPPGSIKLGTWIHTGQFPDNRLDTNGIFLGSPLTNGVPFVNKSNFGIYAIVDQMLIPKEGNPAAGLSTFARFFYSPADKSFFEFYGDSGFVYTGPIPGRDDDQVGVAFAYGSVSGDISDVQEATGAPVQDYTAVIELTYRAQLTPWFALQPDFQYVFRPDAASSSSGGLSDAVVLGVRAEVVF